MSALTVSIQHYTGSPNQLNKAGIETEGTKTGKDEIHCLCFETVYIKKNPKEFTKEPLELVSFSKAADTRSIHKYQLYLQRRQTPGKQIKKTKSAIYNRTLPMKFLHINL